MERKIWSFNEGNKPPADTGKRKKYGYARVSTEKQRLRRQIDDIKAVCPEAIIFSETYSGTKSERPEWQKLLRLCRLGFVSEIWFCDVSRMSRDRESGYKTWKKLYDMGIELHFIQTPQVDTTTYKEALGKMIRIEPSFSDDATNELVQSILKSINDYMVSLAKRQIYIAFDEAEAEAKHLSQRTKEGMAIARMNGKNIGRKEGIAIQTRKRQKAVPIIEKYYEGFGGMLSATECIRLCKISKSSFYRFVDQINKELMNEPVQWDYTCKKKGRT